MSNTPPVPETVSNLVSDAIDTAKPDTVGYGFTGKEMSGIIADDGSFVQAVYDYFGALHAQVTQDSRAALTAALNAVTNAITAPNGLTVDILALTAAVVSLGSPIGAQSTATQAMAVSMASLLAQQQSNGTTQAALLASALRQEANQLLILAATNGIDADAKAAAIQAHADAQAELTAIQTNNAAIATAHADALNQLAATQAAQSQAHADAQAQATALSLIHSDDVATQAALTTLHTDDQGLQTALTSLLAAIGTENATLSAISLSDAGTLATLKAILAGGAPFSASPAAGATATLFQAGANGSVITALGATSTSTLGTLLLSIFSTPSATGTTGTLLQTVELVVGANAPVLQNVAIPANAYVRTTASIAGASVFGARKDL